MSAVADQLPCSALSSATANENPVVVAFVRESHMRQDAEGFARSCEGLAQAEKADHRLIDCPTLIVTGDEDPVGPASIAHELADKIGGAKTVILHRCGHWTPIEKSKECGKLLIGIPARSSDLTDRARLLERRKGGTIMAYEANGWNGNASGPILFTNVRVLDGTGEYPYTGEVLVQGNRIKQVTRGSSRLSHKCNAWWGDGHRWHGRDPNARNDRRAPASVLEQRAGHRPHSDDGIGRTYAGHNGDGETGA